MIMLMSIMCILRRSTVVTACFQCSSLDKNDYTVTSGKSLQFIRQNVLLVTSMQVGVADALAKFLHPLFRGIGALSSGAT